MNESTDKPIAGYGDEGAEILVARFATERWNRVEPGLWAMGVNPHAFQQCLKRQQLSLDRLRSVPSGEVTGESR